MKISTTVTLMDPDHIEKEILELRRWEIEIKQEADRIHKDVERIIGYVAPSYNRGEPTMLDTEQVKDIIVTLTNIDIHRERHLVDMKFTRRAYLALKQDRRWTFGSKLKFLRNR